MKTQIKQILYSTTVKLHSIYQHSIPNNSQMKIKSSMWIGFKYDLNSAYLWSMIQPLPLKITLTLSEEKKKKEFTYCTVSNSKNNLWLNSTELKSIKKLTTTHTHSMKITYKSQQNITHNKKIINITNSKNIHNFKTYKQIINKIHGIYSIKFKNKKNMKSGKNSAILSLTITYQNRKKILETFKQKYNIFYLHTDSAISDYPLTHNKIKYNIGYIKSSTQLLYNNKKNRWKIINTLIPHKNKISTIQLQLDLNFLL
uniref:Uncharacterized protein n=1 Tax=Tabachnickia sp. DVL-2014 TaxID=1569960 RepID=A0A0N6W8Z1_9METZ|nr:hypothetical protein [Tabachnickia sp. DVL-2014]